MDVGCEYRRNRHTHIHTHTCVCAYTHTHTHTHLHQNKQIKQTTQAADILHAHEVKHIFPLH